MKWRCDTGHIRCGGTGGVEGQCCFCTCDKLRGNQKVWKDRCGRTLVISCAVIQRMTAAPNCLPSSPSHPHCYRLCSWILYDSPLSTSSGNARWRSASSTRHYFKAFSSEGHLVLMTAERLIIWLISDPSLCSYHGPYSSGSAPTCPQG